MTVVRGFAATLEDELHVVPFTDLTLHQTFESVVFPRSSLVDF